MSPYQLIIFDWDGTLMDSQSRIVACIQAACHDEGLSVPGEDLSRNVIGLGIREACRQLLPLADNEVHQRVMDRYREHFAKTTGTTPSPIFEGVEAMLQDLIECGHFLALATGMERTGLDAVLAKTGLDRYFHASRCVDETACKPNPRMLQELLDYFELDPEQAIMVGDTEYDLEMARSAGMDALAVSYGVHEEKRLLPLGPRACVDSIQQLHVWLKTASSENRFKTTSPSHMRR